MNAIGEAMEKGPNNLSVPLSPTGQGPATHYGCHTWAEQDEITWMENPPPPYDASLAMQNLAMNYVLDGVPTETFNALLTQMGLQRVEVAI